MLSFENKIDHKSFIPSIKKEYLVILVSLCR